MTGSGREDFVEVADDLRGVADRILGKHHAVERVVLEPGAQRLFVERAVDRQQPADAGQGKAKPQLDRGEAFGEDDGHQ